METIIQHAQQTLDQGQARIFSYISPIMKAIAKTYFVPFMGVFFARIAMYIANESVMGGLFLGLPGTVVSVAIFLGILYYGLRFSEKHWHGTGLLVAYSAVSKARRLLETQLGAESPDPLYIKQATENYATCVDTLMQAVDEYGIQAKAN